MTFVCKNKEYTSIPLSELYFDEKVADMVEENKSIFPETLLNNIYASDAFSLEQKRLDSVLDGWDSGKIPPVSVVKQLKGYRVLNGRHRVCATIMKGGTSIPCQIQETQ